MARGQSVLIVVGRDQAPLYEYFRWGFSQTSGVEVVLDRRLGQRRRRNSDGSPDERRRGDRRRTAGGRAELLARGFLIVRRGAPDGVRDWGARR